MMQQLRHFASLVKLSHTVFGLPFALASTALAHRAAIAHGERGLDAWRVLLIVLAFAGARAAAMGFNRIVDRRFDAANPRTADREIPKGVISLRAAWTMTIVAALVFCGASLLLGPLPAVLAPACLVVLFGYSLFKRVSWSSHLVLGIALALAPGGAWIAVTGGLPDADIPIHLMIAVATWVAGFDIIYALQDESFDRKNGLHSIPARFGTTGALAISALLHVGTVAALVVVHLHAGLGWVHGLGVAAIAIVLAYEHAIVRPGDLSRINRAFFDLNGWVSLGYLAAVLGQLALN
ncbi:MAG TPA: UbiA-like polyprenyltransferase [Nannocystaceae bacterium]|nr:UbiA-like polyprenyltransferase [Nannocystaceae bacterium]